MLSTVTYGVTTEPSAAAAQEKLVSTLQSTTTDLIQPEASQVVCSEAGGVVALRDPLINRGCATSLAVRQQRHMSGLLPPRQVRWPAALQASLTAVTLEAGPSAGHILLVKHDSTSRPSSSRMTCRCAVGCRSEHIAEAAAHVPLRLWQPKVLCAVFILHE